MSIAIEANILLYASDDGSPYHDQAVATLRDLAAGPELLYLF